MGRPERALYTSARHLLRRFQAEDLPFTGVAGSNLICWNLNSASCLNSWFHRPGPHASLEEGLKLLGRLDSQFLVLQQCEEETREALAGWAALARQWPQTSLTSSALAAAACEAGMNELTQQVRNLINPLGLEEEEEDYESDDEGISIQNLIDAVHQQAPQGNTPVAITERLHVLVDVLYRQNRLRYEPFEWVYEGLKPLLLEDVLKRRKGTPAALAMAAAAVGRAVGVPLLPMPASPIEAGAGQDPDAAVPVENLPPELALRVSSTTQAAAPGPGPWLLRLSLDTNNSTNSSSTATGVSSNEEQRGEESNSALSNSGLKSTQNGENQGEALYVDAGSGEVLRSPEVLQRYPAVANLSEKEWREQCVLRTWQGLSRIAMQAHQRRGESDLVAQWMYVALALDPGAPEWNRALEAPEIASTGTLR